MSEVRARRYNRGKPRYELIPTGPLRALVDVYTKGAHKYSLYKDKEGRIIKGEDIPLETVHNYELLDDGAQNWRKGLSWSETIGAVERHIAAWKNNENIDPDLKTQHLANAAWGLFSLMEYAHSFPQGDDRTKTYLRNYKIGLDLDGVLADFVGHLTKVSGHEGYSPVYWNDPIIRAQLDIFKDDVNFWATIPPLIDGSSLWFEPHCYITARPIPNEVSEQWLDTYKFPKAPVYTVGHGITKVEAALKAGIDYFVDDGYVNFVELNNAGITTFLYTAPYNVKYNVGDKRINSLEELKALLGIL